MNFQIPMIEKLHRVLNPEPRVPFIPTSPAAEQAVTTEAAITDESLPPVIMPPERDLRVEVNEILAPVSEYLTGLTFATDLQPRYTALLEQFSAFRQGLIDLLTDDRAQRIETLTTEQEEMAQQCREQRKVLDGVLVEFTQKTSELRQARFAIGKARAELQQCEESEPNLDNWPTRQELADWESRCTRAREALAEAERLEANVIAAGNEVRRRVIEAKTKFNELAEAEKILRDRLSGKPVRDSETGLLAEPEI